jgi:hypothetical protein
MRTSDCTDIKVLLSALVDDQIDAEGRYAAERHLAECEACRRLMEQAESLDALVSADIRRLVDPRGLPAEFERQVLARTVRAQEPQPYLRQWTTWTGWLAAAAALALAVAIWIADRRVGMTPRTIDGPFPEPVTTEAFPAAYDTGTRLRSLVLTDDPSFGDTSISPEVMADDSQTLYALAVILSLALDTDAAAQSDLTMIRRAIEYDELLPRTADLLPRLAPEDRPLIRAARAVMYSLAHPSLEPRELHGIRQDVVDLDMHRAIDALSRRSDARQPL